LNGLGRPFVVIDLEKSSMQEQKLIWVRPREGARLAGVGIVKFYELLNAGIIESIKLGGMRLVRVSSIENLGK
jgi:hypothetical protein